MNRKSSELKEENSYFRKLSQSLPNFEFKGNKQIFVASITSQLKFQGVDIQTMIFQIKLIDEHSQSKWNRPNLRFASVRLNLQKSVICKHRVKLNFTDCFSDCEDHGREWQCSSVRKRQSDCQFTREQSPWHTDNHAGSHRLGRRQ